jgi:hypothetical protein
MPAIGIPGARDDHPSHKENNINQKYKKPANCITSMVYALIPLR